jgi:uncharacterized protein (DUF488 family)
MLLTIGHSKHPLARFLELLRQHAVSELVDVRSKPVSRFSPHFNKQVLGRSLAEAGIRYTFAGEALGGRPSDPDLYDSNGHVLYARLAQREHYRRGIARLVESVAAARTCVMCAEEDPARCHRRLLIAETLVARGVDVQHIRGDGAVVGEAELRGSQLRLL